MSRKRTALIRRNALGRYVRANGGISFGSEPDGRDLTYDATIHVSYTVADPNEIPGRGRR